MFLKEIFYLSLKFKGNIIINKEGLLQNNRIRIIFTP